jgi:hypothetical protein
LDLLDVDVDGGHVRLSGEVPSSAEREIAVRVVCDELGFDAGRPHERSPQKQGKEEPKHGITVADPLRLGRADER